MKNNTKLAVKISTFFVVFIFLVMGLYAQSKLNNTLAFHTTSKTKPMLKTKSKKEIVYASVTKKDIVNETHETEDRIFNFKIKDAEKERQFEEWMYDEYFWRVKVPEWDQEPEEKPYELEEWMFHLELKTAGCIDIFSDFKEQKWMRKHNFLIL